MFNGCLTHNIISLGRLKFWESIILGEDMREETVGLGQGVPSPPWAGTEKSCALPPDFLKFFFFEICILERYECKRHKLHITVLY